MTFRIEYRNKYHKMLQNITDIMAKKKYHPTQRTSSELAFSSFHARFEQLEKDRYRLLDKIKRQRSELSNFLEQMHSIALEIAQRSAPFHQKIIQLDREIHTWFAEIFTDRKFGKKSRHKIKKVYRMLQIMGLISSKENEDQEDLESDWTEAECHRNDARNASDFNSEFNADSFHQKRENDRSNSDLKQMRRT